jgi:hypothetical protein
MKNVSVQICAESDFTERRDLTQKNIDRSRNCIRRGIETSSPRLSYRSAREVEFPVSCTSSGGAV